MFGKSRARASSAWHDHCLPQFGFWAEGKVHRRDFLKGTGAIAGGAALVHRIPSAWAETPKDTLLVLVENGPNSLDIHGVGTTFRSYVACWNLYDRLLTFGHKSLPDGGLSYDYTKIEPELAEDFNVSPEGMSVTFKLRRNATFHDGAPVTAHDVKWSLDRAVTVGGFPTFQMAAGSLQKPEQFVLLDDHTIRIDFLRKDKLTLPDLAVVVPAVFNSKLARSPCQRQRPLGDGVGEDQRCRRRSLQARALDPRPGDLLYPL